MLTSTRGVACLRALWVRFPLKLSRLGCNCADAKVTMSAMSVSGADADGSEDRRPCIIDRKKGISITGDENVCSKEVEEAIRGIERVRDVAVVGLSHPEWGEIVVAVVVTSDGRHLGVDELREHLSEKLAKCKVPREVIIGKGLPRNPSGKILKHKIRAEVNSWRPGADRGRIDRPVCGVVELSP